MFEIKALENGVLQVSHSGVFTVADWQEYQRLMLEQLDQTEQPLYILSDFRQTTSFHTEIIREVGTARHLIHPKLGLIVLLGGSSLTSFVLLLTEARALKENQSEKLRVHRDYHLAMQALLDAKVFAESKSNQPTQP